MMFWKDLELIETVSKNDLESLEIWFWVREKCQRRLSSFFK